MSIAPLDLPSTQLAFCSYKQRLIRGSRPQEHPRETNDHGYMYHTTEGSKSHHALSLKKAIHQGQFQTPPQEISRFNALTTRSTITLASSSSSSIHASITTEEFAEVI